MKDGFLKLVTEIELSSKNLKKALFDEINAHQKESLADNCKKLSIINQLSCNLAEKEICDKYGKLSEELYNKEDEYFDVYQDEFNALYDRYWHKLAQLSNYKNI